VSDHAPKHLVIEVGGEGRDVYLPHYFSTSCLHDLHDECKGVCKFCPAKCRCECHREKP
jgi:hypothetical protein